jgi:signal transduction histidine kinase
MHYSLAVKFIAIFLTAVALVAIFSCTLGIVQVAELGLYTDGFDGWIHNRLEWQAYSLAEDLTDRYAVKALTNCPDELLEQLGYWYVFQDSIHWTGLGEESYNFAITDLDGALLASAKGLLESAEGFFYQTGCSIRYPVLVTDEEVIDEAYGTDYLRSETIEAEIYGNKPVVIRYYESPEYSVEIQLDPDAGMARSGTSLELVRMIYEQRYNLMIVLGIALAVFAVGLVYLCWAAGKGAAGSAVSPGGLNRLPLDVYAAAGGGAGFLLAQLALQMMNHWIFGMDNLNPGTLTLVGIVLLVIAVLCVGFLFAVSAQIKVGNLYWWRRSVLGWLCRKLSQGIRFLWKSTSALFDMMPVIWRYILIGGTMGIALVAAVLLWGRTSVFLLIPVILIYILVVLYGGYAYGLLLQGAEKMAKGDLNAKIDKRFLVGAYAKCADHLNALADVAILAAKNQMKSERMRAELITNVTHDIKTPLTSIINYVDLLESAPDKEAAQQYLEVLGRQSQRLKKLIEDLMEMSKASSGNMVVDLVRVDPTEAVNQALGEFSDKLAARELTVVFRQPEQPLAMVADGRLSWRVLSNLLSNIVKYALPGTRVYADVLQLEEQVLISLKNISKEPLNISADELTERFVRGDTSRNTEGSGLGLNIAKSLMELQKGQLQLLVDGDLFKVTLVFPKAE